MILMILLQLFKWGCEERFGGNEMSFQFDITAAEKLPKLSKEASRALREAYEKDVALLQRYDSGFIPLLPIEIDERVDLSEAITRTLQDSK